MRFRLCHLSGVRLKVAQSETVLIKIASEASRDRVAVRNKTPSVHGDLGER